MKKRSSFYRTFENSAILVFFLILSACAGKDDIQISVTGDENFPVIKVGNPGRQPVVFQSASSAIGSIGFADGDSIIWLTGKPAVNATMGQGNVYIWEIDSVSKVMLKLMLHCTRFRFLSERARPSSWLI